MSFRPAMRRPESSMVTPPPLIRSFYQSSTATAACRAVSLCTANARGLYGQFGFLLADERVMQWPRPGGVASVCGQGTVGDINALTVDSRRCCRDVASPGL